MSDYERAWQEGFDAYHKCPVPPCPYMWGSTASIGWFTGLSVAKTTWS